MSVFAPYKDRHRGESVLILGSGPSIFGLSPEHSFPGYTVIGTNEAVYLPFNTDYYFIGDAGTPSRGYLSDPQTYIDYTPRRTKFFRIKTHHPVAKYTPMPGNIPGVTYYPVDKFLCGKKRTLVPGRIITGDLTAGVSDAGSISFEALQFALWCGFSDVVLAGMDCDYSSGSFRSAVTPQVQRWGQEILRRWAVVARDVSEVYPGACVQIWNPVAMHCFKELTAAPTLPG